MIVRCPQCRSRYRVREDKLPPGGGHIRCPSCGEVFPAIQEGPQVPVDQAPTTSLLAPTPSEYPDDLSYPTPPFPIAPGVSGGARPPTLPPQPPGEGEPTQVLAIDTSAPWQPTGPPPFLKGLGPQLPQRPAEPLSISPPLEAVRPRTTERLQWKLKSPVGLVYDFPDLQALKSWLSTKDNVDGMLASKDGGGTWEILENYPELVDSLPRKLRRLRGMPGAAERSRSPGPTGASGAFPTLRPGTPPAGEGLPPEPPTMVLTARPGGTEPIGSAADSGATTLLQVRETGPPFERIPRAPAERRIERTQDETRGLSGERFRVPVPAPGRSASISGVRRRPGSRSYSGVTTGHHARLLARKKKKIGWWTRLGLLLTILILVAGALQVSGRYDVIGILGLRASPEAEQAVQTAATPGVVTGQPQQAAVQAVGPMIPVGPTTGPTGIDLAAPPVTGLLVGGPQPGTNPHQARIDALVYQARLAAGEGRYEDAISHLRIASQLDRTNPELYCLLAELHWQAGWFQEADALDIQCRTMRGTVNLNQNLTSGRQSPVMAADDAL